MTLCTQALDIFINSKTYCQSSLLIAGVLFETQNWSNKISKDSHQPVIVFSFVFNCFVFMTAYKFSCAFNIFCDREAVTGGENTKPLENV